MEISDNKEEFQKLLKKRKGKNPKEREPTDFDKILKGILKVPKEEKPSLFGWL